MIRALPLIWLLFFFALPFLAVIKLSFSHLATAIPPYIPVFTNDISQWYDKMLLLSFNNYTLIIKDDLYIKALITSLKISIISTGFLAILGFAIAYSISKSRHKILFLTLIMIPFWTSFLIRVYAWIGILKPQGYLSQVFTFLGLAPPELLYSDAALIIGVVYSYLPFMILPIFAGLEALDKRLLEAASDLGASPKQAFIRVTLPIMRPSIIAGCLICFIPIMGEILIPDLLGGNQTLMLGKVIWIEFFNNRDWPVASALAVILLSLVLLPFYFWRRQQ